MDFMCLDLWNPSTLVVQDSLVNIPVPEFASHAAKADAKASAEEAEKLRRQSASHAAALRRCKVRQQQLEDALVSIKHDLEASQTKVEQAEGKAHAAIAKVGAVTRRAAAAEVSAKAAQAELAAEADKVAAVREESRARLASMQEASCEALRSTEAAASEQVHRLTLRVTELKSEKKCLEVRLQEAQARLRSPEKQQPAEKISRRDGPAESGNALVVTDEGNKASEVIADLQRRNHQLQMALAQKLVAEVGVHCSHTAFLPTVSL
jgi:chromosome segregation ATPase